MALIGRMHPLLVHFPIALVLMAAIAELMATFSGERPWRTVAVANVRIGAVLGLIAAIAGWRLALAPGVEASSLLEFHRWIGAVAVAATLAAALVSSGADGRSPFGFVLYRVALFASAALVAVTGHFGGLLVWGSDFLRP
jgi:uncharacterized membrane protein